ncbi:MAG: hypothetical protein IPG17_12585 [Sandaracinaceae bacterium]|jgi:hypothetical protein|nr:hypothetical protein [Sandaracinaceae bacterium]MBP7680443.1 hypothetical protein [Deltaproteobacteria bacterium]MBK6809085.1 hypothetical protein [Sandaracinaceae bacterium]MBK7153509.1 hypothetical protein [Sandaracinaceae bacterium]MBK7772582.1 hypothetical protein [Sandaracinaceae bacterium]
MLHLRRSAPRVSPNLALLLVLVLATACGGLIRYNSGETTQQARDAAATETGLSLCDPLDLPNLGFEEPVLPGEMLYNSYASVRGWRSPHGDLLIGRGNLGLDHVPDNAAYGDQHGILKPRRAGQVRAQDNTEVEYPLSLRVGQRYALVLSAMSPAAGSTVTLSMTGADISPYEFSAPGSWRQRVVPFTAQAEAVTLRIVTGERSDVGALGMSRGEVDILVDVAGVFPICDAAATAP